jgi:hypothetical protein
MPPWVGTVRWDEIDDQRASHRWLVRLWRRSRRGEWGSGPSSNSFEGLACASAVGVPRQARR